MAVAPSGSRPMQLEPDHRGQQHGGGLAEHARLGFNAADAPADHAQSVDHGGVRIGADHGIGIRAAIVVEDHRSQIFEIHLVHDAGIGRHRAEIPKRRLSPAQERIALAIALVFEQRIGGERAAGAELVDLHGMVDHQIHRDQRIGLLGIGAHLGERVAHRGEIDHAGHAGEILQQHACRAEVDLRGGSLGIPLGDVLDVGLLDGGAVFKAQQVLEKNLDRVRNARELGDPGLLQRGEAKNLVLAAAGFELARGAKGILTCHGYLYFIAPSRYMYSGTSIPSTPSVCSSCARK